MGTIGSPKMIRSLAVVSSVFFFMRKLNRMLHATVWGHPRAFNNQYKDREYLIQYYHRWLAEVKEVRA